MLGLLCNGGEITNRIDPKDIKPTLDKFVQAIRDRKDEMHTHFLVEHPNYRQLSDREKGMFAGFSTEHGLTEETVLILIKRLQSIPKMDEQMTALYAPYPTLTEYEKGNFIAVISLMAHDMMQNKPAKPDIPDGFVLMGPGKMIIGRRMPCDEDDEE